jgi:amino acid transporter
MTEQPAAAGIAPVPPTRLAPDAIGVAQDTVIGMASSAPAGTVAATLAVLAAATAYGAGPVLVLTAIPMLIIANAYRRLNMWSANCGASFECVGRAISPYLGFLTGWVMVAGYVITTVAEVVVLGPSVLTVFGDPHASTWSYVWTDTGLCAVMLAVAVAGIRMTARTQIVMAAVEYAILIGLSVAGLVLVLGHHPGTYPPSGGWLSLTGISGKGSLAAGLLISVYVYSAWDGTVYVNEEVRHRRVNPGRAALWAVGLLAVIYTLAQAGLQGVVSPARLQAHAASALVYTAQQIGGPGWARAMALAIALSVTAATGTGIVLTARIIYGMAARQVFPPVLSTVSPRLSTPVPTSIIAGFAIIAVTWAYLLTASVTSVFASVISVAGLLFTIFYIMAALATIAYYRRRILGSARDLVTAGVLPLAAAGFLGWVLVRSLQAAPAGQRWSVTAVIAAGVVLMIVARLGLRSEFFAIPRESDAPRGTGRLA